MYAMTITLPEDLERFIRAEVHSGHFACEEDAIVEAIRLLRRQLSQAASPTPATGAPTRVRENLAATIGAIQNVVDEPADLGSAWPSHSGILPPDGDGVKHNVRGKRFLTPAPFLTLCLPSSPLFTAFHKAASLAIP
jgi:Arc/MetJ-type ribon-helix-helix transcriptional regulator